VNITSIQGRLNLLFTAFFLLVAVSVAATFWGIETQKKDAMLVNLAGRQRMLVQQMTRLTLEIERQAGPDSPRFLQEAIATFDQTLLALREGGPAPYSPGQTVTLPPGREKEIQLQLDRLRSTWPVFRISLETILVSTPGESEFQSALRSVEELSPQLVEEADSAVRMFESAASRKLARLRWFQAGFFIAALALLGAGAVMTRRSVISPLVQLGAAARRLGSGDLDTRAQVDAPDEVQLLADTFESTRVQLKESRAELLHWANMLEERVAQRTQEIEALYQVSRDISSRLEVQNVLRLVTEKARQLLGVEIAFLCLLDEQGQILNLHSTSGPPEAASGTATRMQAPLPRLVLGSERAVMCGVEGCLGSCQIVAAPYRVSQMAAPLRMGERVIGALCVGSPKTGVFSEEAQNLLTRLAHSGAIALENARLYAQAERVAVLEERQRIAAEMHDGLAQTLNYLRMTVEMGRGQVENQQLHQALITLELAQRGMDQAECEVRQAIASLQESYPLYYPLQEQLANLAEELSSPSLRVEWSPTLLAPLILPPHESEQVLRVAREALLNACHHARAQRILLKLDQQDGRASVSVLDDGKGFDPEALPEEGDRRQHFGLKIMQARATRIGGSLQVISSPGQGTCVTLTWPLPNEEKEELVPKG
jgi:two-component system, NarL family, nitrate/nitrite sensor histidine kinase NarX